EAMIFAFHGWLTGQVNGITSLLLVILKNKKDFNMIGLTIAIIAFNFIAFKTNKRLTNNQIFHIWAFTIAFQQIFDLYIDMKYHGYWYFTKNVDWKALPAHTVLIPPVNMMFLNWFPFNSSIVKKIMYIFVFVISILIYESVTLLPEPWGYFHYGWWKLWHAAIIDPILLFILLGYYKLVCKAEKNLIIKEK
ncbi:hypothetical protein ACIFOT_30030, partial [Neobacillus sp. NRS-1170]|uniref:hypothetical protein n=1 Tax=Neobacillus sp. NRS-1170 TaxID=3233898 RepID=UPI003D277BE1